MKYYAIAFVILGLVTTTAYLSLSAPVGAQDGSEATIASLKTRVADLKATIAARSATIAALKTQVVELNGDTGEPTAVPQPDFVSGGLGLSRKEWEKEHGKGEDNGLITYEDKTFLVLFNTDESTANIVNLTWNLPALVDSLDDARAIALTKLPSDTVITGTGSDISGNVREYCYSESLAARFDADSSFWGTSGPGSCFINYYPESNGSGGPIQSLLIAIGDK